MIHPKELPEMSSSFYLSNKREYTNLLDKLTKKEDDANVS
jgi:hypothetical protein